MGHLIYKVNFATDFDNKKYCLVELFSRKSIVMGLFVSQKTVWIFPMISKYDIYIFKNIFFIGLFINNENSRFMLEYLWKMYLEKDIK